MSLEEFIGDFAKTKPHMVRSSDAAGGSGASRATSLAAPAVPVVDYKTMPRDKFLDLAQSVIDQSYKR